MSPWLPLVLAACASGNSGGAESGAGSGPGDDGPFGNATPPATTAGASGSGGPSGGPSGQGAMGCNDLLVSFEPVVPIILLLIDRSGSMWESAYGPSPTRWQAVYDGLMDPTIGVVHEFEHDVRFGLMTYTGDTTSRTCPVVTSVLPALDNYAAVTQVYDEASVRPTFKADTPTGPGVRAATAALLGLPVDPDMVPGPKSMILITDGEPDTCATPDPNCGQDESIAAVQAAFAEGIATTVIGISGDVGVQHLQDVANAGSGLPVRAPDMQFTYNCINPGYATMSASYATAAETPGTAPVYQPADRDALATMLRSIIRGVSGCSFALNGEVALEKADRGTVALDDQDLGYQDANGWLMRDARTLELVGDACTRVKTAASRLLISFPCDVVDVF